MTALSAPDRLRVAVVIDPRARAGWHAAVVDALRAAHDVATGVVLDAAAPVDPGSERIDIVVDCAGVECAIAPTYGVWRFGFGDGAPVADGAAGTRARLYRVTPDAERAVVLHEGWYRARTPDAGGTRSVGHRV